MSARIKQNDMVLITHGKDKGRRGKVQRFFPGKNKVLVEGLNMSKRHLRAGAQGVRQGGIVDQEVPLDASKVMPICQACDKPTRIAIQILDDGTKARVCKRCNSMMT